MRNDTALQGDVPPERGRDLRALDRSLERAAAALETARAVLALRRTIGRNLRVAIRCLLEAQEKIEKEGPSTAARLDLLEAIRLIGGVEQEIKASLSEQAAEKLEREAGGRVNRRAFHRRPARMSVELEPQELDEQQDISSPSVTATTVNMSKGGMLAEIDQGILRHGRYLIRFLEESGAIQPAVTWGAVRRSRARNKGWEVGIEFDDPLEDINE